LVYGGEQAQQRHEISVVPWVIPPKNN